MIFVLSFLFWRLRMGRLFQTPLGGPFQSCCFALAAVASFTRIPLTEAQRVELGTPFRLGRFCALLWLRLFIFVCSLLCCPLVATFTESLQTLQSKGLYSPKKHDKNKTPPVANGSTIYSRKRNTLTSKSAARQSRLVCNRRNSCNSWRSPVDAIVAIVGAVPQ